jgi:ABC-type cobalamin transport system permease subunit
MWLSIVRLILAVLDARGYDWSVPEDRRSKPPEDCRWEPRFSRTTALFLFASALAVVGAIIVTVTLLTSR